MSDPPHSAAPTAPTNRADTVYTGGDILTMEGDTPQYVEALAVADGTIVYVGDESGTAALAGDARRIDLEGRTLLPGFIDAHGHVWNTGFQALAANLLPPPDGEGSDIASLISITRDWAANNEQAVRKIGWIIGFGYDDAQLEERRHPTADASTDAADVVDQGVDLGLGQVAVGGHQRA